MNFKNNKSPAPVADKNLKITLLKEFQIHGKSNPLAFPLTSRHQNARPQLDSRYVLLCSKSRLPNKSKELEELLMKSKNLEEKLKKRKEDLQKKK